MMLPVDRREFSPVPALIRPARRFSGRPATLVAPKPVRASGGLFRKSLRIPWGQILFKQPEQVAVCVQRGVRREVLHAKGIAGGHVRPGRRGPYSNVRC